MTTDNRKADARWYIALLLWFVANVALGAAIVGVIDIAFDKSATGHVLLVRGLAAMVTCAALALVVRPGRPREGHRFATIAIGLWPFAMFFFFIVWRSGVSGEQRVACHNGDTQACYRLGERLDRRGKPEEAVDIYGTGCEAGGAQCCLMHGSLLERGRGTEPATAAALLAYDSGCELGEALACWRWSQLAERTDAPEEAILEHVERACSLGYANACTGAAQGSP